MYDAIILAGGENKSLCENPSHPYEAMIDIDGRPMVAYVAEALAVSRQIDRIFIVGPAQELASCRFPERTVILQGGRTIMETIQIGMAALGHTNKVLVATADIPLVTPDALNDFLNQCQPFDADLYYPIVSRKTNDSRYPGNRRTYVRMRENTYTGGNVFLVNPLIVDQCVRVAEKIIENRKRPLKLCQILGWSFVFQFLIGTLGLDSVEKRVSDLLGIRGKVFETFYPELGLDVDKPSDLELVRNTFSVKAQLKSI